MTDAKGPVGTCPVCGGRMRVLYCRSGKRENVIAQRRRACRSCDYRCSTHEIIVSDDLGFANDDARRVIEFRQDIDAVIHRHFGDDEMSSARAYIKTERRKTTDPT